MDSYTKKLKIKFDASFSSVKKIGKDFNKAFEQDIKISGADIYNKLKGVGAEFLTGIKGVFESVWKELDSILSYSKLSNSRTRELAFQYGFTGSQAYGFDKAMGLLGFSSIEDLWYANDQEREQFNRLFDEYIEKYDKLYDQGFFTKLQEYNVEMKNFQEELKLEVVEFLMENKETIKDGMVAIMELAKFGLQIVEILTQGFNYLFGVDSNSRIAAASDIISNYQNNKTVNAKVDYTFNGVSANDRNSLIDVGQQTYGQIIRILKEGA